ncbi:MAG: hypothetical protein AB1402_02455 [Bacillota bacterium]
MSAMDSGSRLLFWYLASRGHASIAEMAAAVAAVNHFEVLRRLEEVINPAALTHLGAPAAEFRERDLDPVTGAPVMFHWWCRSGGEQRSAGLADVFDEAGRLKIFVQVPLDFRAGVPDVRINNGILEITIPHVRAGCNGG